MIDACTDGRPSNGCAASRKLLGVDAIELGEDQPGVPNRVDADVPPAAVRRAPVHRHVDPHEAEVRRHDRQPRRLGDDRRVGAHARAMQRARPDALVFFVDDRGDDRCPRRAAAAAARAAAHIAATPDFMSPIRVRRCDRRARARPRRVRHPVDADDVEVAVEHQRSSAAAPAPTRATTFGRPGAARCSSTRNPHAREHVGERARDRRFARAARHERRIARIDAHELARQRDGVAARVLASLRP